MTVAWSIKIGFHSNSFRDYFSFFLQSFQSTPLLKYIGDKLIENPSSCRTMSSLEIFTIVQGFANNCFIPETADNNEPVWTNRILPEILANQNLAKFESSNNLWLQFTLQLAVLGHFDQNSIARVLNASYLKRYLERNDLNTLDLYKILILYQTVAMHPDIDMHSLTDSNTILNVCKMYAEQMPSCDIQLDLIDHYGTSFVLTNVRTKFMHLIPTLVKINKQTGHFERFSDNISRDGNGFILLDKIPCHDNEVLWVFERKNVSYSTEKTILIDWIYSNRVCVDSIKRYHLFSNFSARKYLFGVSNISDDMKIGAFRLRLKQLEQLGLSVCEINYRRYKNLRLGNKSKYLQENITKCATQTDHTLN